MKKEIIIFLITLFYTISIYSQCTPPQPVSPENGSIVYTLNPQLCWSDGHDFGGWPFLQVSANQSFNNLIMSYQLMEWPGCRTLGSGLDYNHWYWWRIEVHCYPWYPFYSSVYSFQTSITAVRNISSEVPENFSLSQNYPNPFNPTTNIKFQLSKLSDVELIIYDLLGREVETLINEKLPPGTFEIQFDGTNFADGMYFYKLQAGVFTAAKKMVLLK